MDKKTQYLITAAILIVIIGIAIVIAGPFNKPVASGTENSGATQKNVSVTIRTSSSTSVSPINLADELGYYRDAGITIEYTGVSSGGPQNIMTVASGSNDVGGSAFSAIISAVSQGTKITVVAPNLGTTPEVPDYKWFVLSNSSIKSASDLKGKKIGVNTLGAHAEYVTRAYLKQNGLSADDVQFVVVPIENEEQVLRQGQVDVVAPNGAWVNKIEKAGGVRVLFTDGQITGEMVKTGYFFRTDYVEKNPEVVKAFVNATVSAIEWDKQHRNESRVLLANSLKKQGNNPDIAKNFNGWGIRSPPVIKDHDVQFWIDIMENSGQLKPGQLKPSGIYTNEFNPYA